MATDVPFAGDPAPLLARAIANDRVHSGYLLTGDAEATRATALGFVRALVCETGSGIACERCTACRRSTEASGAAATPIVLDGKGKRGPFYRHVGDHADLLFVERGRDDTRITIGQIRELQSALRLRGFEHGRRAAVIDGADWLHPSAQNALLRILEEPPPRTTIVLAALRPSALLATIRSRCVRMRMPPAREIGLREAETPEATAAIVSQLDGLRGRSVSEILDAAEAYRGGRAEAAEAVTALIDVASEWLRERVTARVDESARASVRELDAYKGLQKLRRDLARRNANPQMVAERLLFGLRDAIA
jgi:DNA polymerase-3 subunit delta'